MTLPAELAQAIRDMGQRFNPEVAKETRPLCAKHHNKAAIAALPVTRDITYGPDDRHRLDLYHDGAGSDLKPVVIFVHGGAFVAGDKTAADDAPFYENVGVWALANGLSCIAMTYRLAPTHGYPAGSEDIAATIAWVHREGKAHGLDPSRIILMGQSAGAVHVATYLAKPELHQIAGGGVSAGVLISGLYDMVTAADNPPKFAYFGKDAAVYGDRSSLGGLIENCRIPLFVAVCEFDPPDFQNQTLQLLNALFERDQHLPTTLYLSGHNHLSSIFLLGSSADTLGGPLAQFVAKLSATLSDQEPHNAI